MQLKTEELGIIKLLLQKGVNPSQPDKAGITPLHEAAYLRMLQVVHMLIDSGAQVNQHNLFLRTPLHDVIAGAPFGAQRKNEGIAIVELLLRRGAQVDCVDNTDETPLDKSIHKGNLSVTALLLTAGADPKQASKAGITPLHRAAYEGRTEIARLLLAQGVQVNARNCWQRAPLADAASIWTSDRSLLINLLLEYGADIDCTDAEGETPLFKAINASNRAVVKTLACKGANPCIAKVHNITPLHRAVYNTNLEMVRLLLAHKAPVNAQDAKQSTPLHDAIWMGDSNLVHMLIDNGASITMRDWRGQTPLEMVPEL